MRAQYKRQRKDRPALRRRPFRVVEGRQLAESHASRTARLIRPRLEASWLFAFAHSGIFASSSAFPCLGAVPALA